MKYRFPGHPPGGLLLFGLSLLFCSQTLPAELQEFTEVRIVEHLLEPEKWDRNNIKAETDD